jgi:hypothetical protein
MNNDAYKNRTDRKTVMYIDQVRVAQNHDDVVTVKLEPVKIVYFDYKPFDAGPDDERRYEEHAVPVDKFQDFVQGKGYMSARDWIDILAQVKKKYQAA